MKSIETLAIAGGRRRAAFRVLAPAWWFLPLLLSGCNPLPPTTTTTTTQPAGPQTYLAPFVSGDTCTSPLGSVAAYAIDDTAQTFTKSTYYVGQTGLGEQEGVRTYYAGTTTKLARGLSSLGLDYEYTGESAAAPCAAPQALGWAFELPNQAGGLIDTPDSIHGQPFAPLVPATSCPNSKTPQTYQFLSLPALYSPGGTNVYTWDPAAETVYGSVDIGGDGSTITLNNIQQYALPSFPVFPASGSGPNMLGAPGAPAVATVASPQTGACSSSYYGYTTVVPGNLSVTDPALSGGGTVLPVSLLGIGPTGLLVQSNGADGEDTLSTAVPPLYQDLLGAGTGAIGLPKPSSPVSTSALVGAQYLGFIEGTGIQGGNIFNGMGPSTDVVSYGFATPPATCNAVAPQTPTMIYGGDFPSNNPSVAAIQSNGGFPFNCDLAIDLGAQDPNNNGLYPGAYVYLGTSAAQYVSCAGYTAGTCTIPAVAIAGQLGGKNAIFLVGLDVDVNGNPGPFWGIYLLQSN